MVPVVGGLPYRNAHFSEQAAPTVIKGIPPPYKTGIVNGQRQLVIARQKKGGQAINIFIQR